ncbi:uncharacterized protein LOC130625912 [Hydractinia symbiolongicarpus]|uniref:uncharacterized protein LOC130625912 n=1 Tax=Hydractinia symbiolongicarpus TaxID=13093 RepID=UPI0025503D90|nr:uncharacterized protein LOC130625912 [Hydractinia symbiolongicarpus]
MKLLLLFALFACAQMEFIYIKRLPTGDLLRNVDRAKCRGFNGSPLPGNMCQCPLLATFYNLSSWNNGKELCHEGLGNSGCYLSTESSHNHIQFLQNKTTVETLRNTPDCTNFAYVISRIEKWGLRGFVRVANGENYVEALRLTSLGANKIRLLFIGDGIPKELEGALLRITFTICGQTKCILLKVQGEQKWTRGTSLPTSTPTSKQTASVTTTTFPDTTSVETTEYTIHTGNNTSSIDTTLSIPTTLSPTSTPKQTASVTTTTFPDTTSVETTEYTIPTDTYTPSIDTTLLIPRTLPPKEKSTGRPTVTNTRKPSPTTKSTAAPPASESSSSSSNTLVVVLISVFCSIIIIILLLILIIKYRKRKSGDKSYHNSRTAYPVSDRFQNPFRVPNHAYVPRGPEASESYSTYMTPVENMYEYIDPIESSEYQSMGTIQPPSYESLAISEGRKDQRQNAEEEKYIEANTSNPYL